ncbi:MAG: hypothetical protein ACOCQ6_01820 [Bacteroidota bacterium]
METKHFIITAFLLISFFLVYGGHEKHDHGAHSVALAGADVSLEGFWALRNNQAGLASVSEPAAGLFYENRFGIRELGFQSAGFVYPFKTGTLGVTVNYSGGELYNESLVGMAYGMKILEGFSLGVQLDFMSSYTGTEEQFNNQAVTFEAGLLYELGDDVTVGFHTFNPMEVSMENETAVILVPAVYSLGAAFHLTEGVQVSTELEKVSHYKESVKLGVEYEVADKTYLRTGVATEPGLFSFGFETSWNAWNIQLASSMHEVLGFSPAISILKIF